MVEHQIVKCKKCHALKLKKEAGSFPSGKNRKWIDEYGKQWSGKTCPNCHRDQVKETKRLIRAASKLNG